MKRGTHLIFLFVLIMIISNLVEITGKEITGEVVTGDATQAVSMSISVLAHFTSLFITSPENKTYLTNTSLLLSYSVINEENIWYNLDNTNNITINSSITFNTSQGGHIIYLYANTSLGNINSTNISFTINSTRFIIFYSEYNGSTSGSSTNFIEYTYEDIQNLSNIILENTQYGKINFNQAINLTNDLIFNDNELDIDSYINLSWNRIEINSTALPNFNKNATLYLYNLTWSEVRILKDGVICPLTICIQESYSEGILKFNATGSSIYSAEEVPAGVTPPSGGGGGGTITEKDFEVDQTSIKILLKQGESFKQSIKITNTETSKQDFQILISPNIKELVSISNNSFSLNAGEEKTIYLNFISDDKTIPEVYTGNLEVKTKDKIKKIPIICSIKSKIILFDLSLDISAKYKERLPGEDLLLQITLFNLGEDKKTNVSIEYIIKDFEGNTLIKQKEEVEVDMQVSFSKRIKLPLNIELGEYLAIVQVREGSSLGSSSEMFNIVKKELGIWELTTNKYFIIGLILLIIVLIVLIVWVYERKKTKKTIRVQKKEIRKAQKRPLEILERAFEEGHIKKSSYLKGKRRIKKLKE